MDIYDIEDVKHRVVWDDSKNQNKSLEIERDGVPFFNCGRRVYACEYGLAKAKKKESYSRQRQPSTSKKVSCPAKITLREVIKFPDFYLPISDHSDFKKRRRAAAIRKAIEKGQIKKERRIYIELPKDTDHTCSVSISERNCGHPTQIRGNNNEISVTTCNDSSCMCGKVHCPFCTDIHFKASTFQKVEEHLQADHIQQCIMIDDLMIVRCNLRCFLSRQKNPWGHFHCPFCLYKLRRPMMCSHLRQHLKKLGKNPNKVLIPNAKLPPVIYQEKPLKRCMAECDEFRDQHYHCPKCLCILHPSVGRYWLKHVTVCEGKKESDYEDEEEIEVFGFVTAVLSKKCMRKLKKRDDFDQLIKDAEIQSGAKAQQVPGGNMRDTTFSFSGDWNAVHTVMTWLNDKMDDMDGRDDRTRNNKTSKDACTEFNTADFDVQKPKKLLHGEMKNNRPQNTENDVDILVIDPNSKLSLKEQISQKKAEQKAKMAKTKNSHVGKSMKANLVNSVNKFAVSPLYVVNTPVAVPTAPPNNVFMLPNGQLVTIKNATDAEKKKSKQTKKSSGTAKLRNIVECTLVNTASSKQKASETETQPPACNSKTTGHSYEEKSPQTVDIILNETNNKDQFNTEPTSNSLANHDNSDQNQSQVTATRNADESSSETESGVTSKLTSSDSECRVEENMDVVTKDSNIDDSQNSDIHDEEMADISSSRSPSNLSSVAEPMLVQDASSKDPSSMDRITLNQTVPTYSKDGCVPSQQSNVRSVGLPSIVQLTQRSKNVVVQSPVIGRSSSPCVIPLNIRVGPNQQVTSRSSIVQIPSEMSHRKDSQPQTAISCASIQQSVPTHIDTQMTSGFESASSSSNRQVTFMGSVTVLNPKSTETIYDSDKTLTQLTNYIPTPETTTSAIEPGASVSQISQYFSSSPNDSVLSAEHNSSQTNEQFATPTHQSTFSGETLPTPLSQLPGQKETSQVYSTFVTDASMSQGEIASTRDQNQEDTSNIQLTVMTPAIVPMTHQTETYSRIDQNTPNLVAQEVAPFISTSQVSGSFPHAIPSSQVANLTYRTEAYNPFEQYNQSMSVSKVASDIPKQKIEERLTTLQPCSTGVSMTHSSGDGVPIELQELCTFVTENSVPLQINSPPTSNVHNIRDPQRNNEGPS